MTDQAIIETPGLAIEEADLEVLRESIASVLADESDRLAVHAFIDGKYDLDARLWRQAGELGWMAVSLPEEFGGFGFSAPGSRVLNSELGRVVAPGPFIPTLAAAQALAETGDAVVRSAWLPRIVAGEISIAIVASSAHGAPFALTSGRISGRRTLLGASDAAVALVPVGESDLALLDMADVRREPTDFWDRTRTLIDITADSVEALAVITDGGVTRSALGRAFAIAVAADCIGLSHGITAKTIDYMKERVQFGRPIGSFQALKHRMVDLVAKIGIAEHVLGQAVESATAGDPAADMWAALAKASASDAASFIAGDCVQLHGGVGYTWEFDVHLYLKRARLNEMLVTNNRTLRDQAAAELASLTRAGRSTLELPAA